MKTILMRQVRDGNSFVLFRNEAGAAAAGGDGSVLGGTGGDGGASGASDGAGGDAAPWHGALPDDLKGNANITKYSSMEELARGHIAQAALVGKDMSRMIELPETPEARLEVYRKLGAPENVEDYKLTAIEGADAALAPDGDLALNFIKSAHAHGVHPEAVQGIYADFVGMLSANVGADTKAAEQARADGLASLDSEWGEARDQNVAAARYGVEKLGLMDWVDTAGVGDDPTFIKAMATIGKSMAEDNVSGTETGRTFGSKLAPAEALAKANSLRQQALHEKNRMRQKELSEEAGKLYKIANGE